MPMICSPETLNLAQKLAKIRQEVGRIENRGWNNFQQYKYAMAADVADEIGGRLSQYNIIIARRNFKIERCEVKDQTCVLFECEYGFLDGDSGRFNPDGSFTGEQLWQPAFGEGRDKGDKAGYKAFTGAFKYLLIQAFCLATGDDPEEDEAPKETKRLAAKRQAPALINRPQVTAPPTSSDNATPFDLPPTISKEQAAAMSALFQEHANLTGSMSLFEKTMRKWVLTDILEVAQPDFERRMVWLQGEVEKARAAKGEGDA